MHISNLPLVFASLVVISSATFHLIAQNPADPSNNEIFENQTTFYVIGSRDDTHDNKCSDLVSGKFSVLVTNFFTFDQDQQCASGLCLTQTYSICLRSVVGPMGRDF